MRGLLKRAKEREKRALEILDRLGLVGKWSKCGRPVIVGALRMGLLVNLDIDIEVYSDRWGIEDGFNVVSELAPLPGVWKVCFSNELEGPDQGLYWQMRYRDGGGDVWKVDTWLLRDDHPDAHLAERFATAMQRVLTEETRMAILGIKESFAGREEVRGIDIYRAVVRDGVRNTEGFIHWTD